MLATKPNILLVEDDEDLREAFRALLEDEGYGVRTAGNGREALESLRQGGLTCLVFLDLMMPVMNGWEFFTERSQDPDLARIPVVVCTADATAAQRAHDVGADGWLAKPTDPDDLIRFAAVFCRPSK